MRLTYASTLVGAEEKKLVPDRGAPESKAELVLFQIGLSGGEVVARIQCCIAQIFPDGSVELICAGARDGDEDPARVAAILCTGTAGEDLKFLEGVRIGKIKRGVLRDIHPGRPIEPKLILSVASASNSDTGARAALCLHSGCREYICNSRNKRRKRHGIPTIQGQFLNTLAVHELPNRSGMRIDASGLSIYLHRLRSFTQREVWRLHEHSDPPRE